ncbi:acetyl-CoA C-acyltransferase, partial [uncultured Marinobacter sp.]|uniref:acetyl-CoA C-acyltransferase n=1 Tax=uncultured Marinobacter sp. TaxID=187379 RepID=UPI0030DC13BE
MQDVVIVAAKRTAIGNFGGSLSSLRADQLGSAVIKAILEETGVPADQISEVILGQVLTAGCGQNPARQAAINAGVPASVPAITINKVCGSGLKAVHMVVQSIRCGDVEMILAGGQESMSQSPHVVPNSRNGQRMGNWTMIDTMITDGLWDAFNDYHMGITAENIVEKYGISREEQDQFAAASQQKAAAARTEGRFKDQIVPVSIPQRKGEPVVVDQDEGPRDGISAES